MEWRMAVPCILWPRIRPSYLKHKHLLIGLMVLFLVGEIVCPPPRRSDQNVPTNAKDHNEVTNDETNDVGVEYNRYLQEVVQLLESDPEFRSKLEKSDPEDIRTGKVAKELEYVNHHVRNKLDELKRQELERLRHLAVQEYERSRGLGIPHDGRQKVPGHVDHRSSKFETEDLRKLIVQTTKDLEEADRKRKESFKEYEMQKEFEHQAKLKEITDEEKRKAEEKAWQDAQKKHAQHPKIHHPGSKQQLEEVWEEQDHLAPGTFNPKTFFALHDLDGNGFWDPDEVKALFAKELDKAYDPNAPEDDMAERYEEMERMREHVFNETDTNRDYLISFAEFLDQTRKQEFQRDPGWNTIEDEPVYTQQEYMEFEHRRQMEIQRLIDQGLLPPHPGMPVPHPNAPYGMQPMPGQYGVAQQPYYPPQQQQQPMAAPQMKPGQQITQQQGNQLLQQQPPQPYGQPQFAQPQQPYVGQQQAQFVQQQQYAGQSPQGQFAQQPYGGQPYQGQFVQQPYAGQPQQGQYAQQPMAGQPVAQGQPQFVQQQNNLQQASVQQAGQNAQPAVQGQGQFIQPNNVAAQNVQQAQMQQQQPQEKAPVVQQQLNQPAAQQQPIQQAVQQQQNQQAAQQQQQVPSVNVQH